MKLLVLADDLTGALDTGIQFVAGRAATRVLLDPCYPLEKVDPSVQVLVVDTESRHLPAAQAAEIVRNIVRQAAALQVPCLYKKTDSALRGNVGAELAAALEESGCEQLHFIPAFPRTRRTTVDGIQYIDGTPVAQSVFGQDPFDPVRFSAVPDILAQQTDLPVHTARRGDGLPEETGIVVYDAETDEDIAQWGARLSEDGKLRVLAGCAGFAAALPELMGLGGAEQGAMVDTDSFLAVCGSVNPITVAQMEEAGRCGFRHIHLTARQLLTPGYFESPEGQALLDQWAAWLKAGENCVLDSNPAPGDGETASRVGEEMGMDLEDLRQHISRTLGNVLRQLVERGIRSTMLVTGGDTLMGFVRAAGVSEIVPVRELLTGSVLSLITVGGTTYNIISKSGGFGERTLVSDLAHLVLPGEERNGENG